MSLFAVRIDPRYVNSFTFFGFVSAHFNFLDLVILFFGDRHKFRFFSVYFIPSFCVSLSNFNRASSTSLILPVIRIEQYTVLFFHFEIPFMIIQFLSYN
ncbi:hypothetical protein C0J52_20882 [Blattella germanica]|nr:hypothetical protein C0J52_20882 [Blattella germanica]